MFFQVFTLEFFKSFILMFNKLYNILIFSFNTIFDIISINHH